MQILDGSTVLGMKQFVTAGRIAVNVSEYYRNLIETAPVIDVSPLVCPCRETDGNGPDRRDGGFLDALTSGISDLALSTLLSNAPGPRILRPGEWDELSYLVDEQVLAGTIIVTMKNGQEITMQMPNSSIDGVAVLVVHYDSIAEAVQLKGADPAAWPESG